MVLHNIYFGSRAVISESSKTEFKDSSKGIFLERSVALLKQKALDNDDNNYIHGKNIHTISTDCIYIHK